ncbi:hypothetical protein [Stenotrophomonas phage RAS14]
MKNGVRLNGRILWFDGDSSFELNTLYDYVLSGKTLNDQCYVMEESEDVAKFNALQNQVQLGVKTELKDISNDWDIPDYYLNLNVEEYIQKKLLEEIDINEELDELDIDDRIDRVDTELKLFEHYGMTNILRTAIYIVETFKQKNVIWGTGRGSSCCCYCLYLIELHDVDSVQFDLDLTEFFRG